MTEIKVGDTVRIKENYPFATGGNNIGVEFEVTEVVEMNFKGSSFYVQGDPRESGIWGKWIEKVEPDPRWRYNDHIVVYPETRDQAPDLGRGVTILNETPLPKIYTRWENRDYGNEDRFEAEITAAAQAYFEAHALPKPAWHDAKEGEVWVVTIAGKPQPFLVDPEQFTDGNEGWNFDDPEIEDARRIYPEPTE